MDKLCGTCTWSSSTWHWSLWFGESKRFLPTAAVWIRLTKWYCSTNRRMKLMRLDFESRIQRRDWWECLMQFLENIENCPFQDKTIINNSSACWVEESEVSCNNFYSSPCRVKSVEYLKFFLISLGTPLVVLEREIFKLTNGCLMSEKIESKWACCNTHQNMWGKM